MRLRLQSSIIVTGGVALAVGGHQRQFPFCARPAFDRKCPFKCRLPSRLVREEVMSQVRRIRQENLADDAPSGAGSNT